MEALLLVPTDFVQEMLRQKCASIAGKFVHSIARRRRSKDSLLFKSVSFHYH